MASHANPDKGQREERLNDVMTAYFRAIDAGEVPDRADLLRGNPEIAVELREFFMAEDQMLDHALPLQPVARASRLETGDTVLLEITGSPVNYIPPRPGPEAFGDYEVMETIAEGGMGVVYKARHRKRGHVVALKVLLAGRFARPSDLERFRNETQIVARLDHRNILPIYEVGEHDHLPFFSMKLMRSGSLTAQLERYRHDVRSAAHLVATLARAVHYAHERGVLHRDLKPDNVLLDDQGEPQLTDFGLAKWTDEKKSPTDPGVIVGTPSYMAPEQTHPGRELVTTRADIYSTGAILYALLTGHAPFRGDSPLEILLKVRQQEPEPLRTRNLNVDRDLEIICLKCLRKEPKGRYESAQALAEDLESWLAGRAIKARPMSSIERTWRWFRHNRVSAALVATVLFFVAFVSWWGFDIIRNDAEIERNATRLVEKANQALEQGRWGEAKEASGEADAFAFAGSRAARRRLAPLLADLRMGVRLEDIRINHLDVDEAGLGLLHSGPRYAEAFRDYGIDVEGRDPDSVAREIKAKAICSKLVAALDRWAQNTPTTIERSHLRAIADAADDQADPLPRRLRHALDTADNSTLNRIASEPRAEAIAPSTIVSLGTGLREHGAVQQEVGLLRAAQQLHPGDFWINLELGTALMLSSPAEPRDALRYFTAALALSNGNPGVYAYLGNAQVKAGKLDDAEATYRQAIALKPNFVVARINLGYLLNELGRLKEGEQSLLEAVKLDPSNHLAYYNLGLSLQRQRDNSRAADAYRMAVSLKPDFAEALNNLGTSLTALGRAREALEALDKALAIRPGYSRAHFNRGYLLDQLHRFDEALESYREAIHYAPDYAEAYYQIAFDLLYQEGRFADAETELQQGIKFLKPSDPMKTAWDRMLAESRRLLELQPRLDAYLQRKSKPSTAAEACELAVFCSRPYHQLYAEAAQLFEIAFAMDPALAKDLRQGSRYYAAGCAARAGCGEGRDKLASSERDRWRGRALAWLRADRDLRGQQIRSGEPEKVKDAKAKLRYWQTDPNLDCVHGAQALGRLSEQESKNWQELWRQVAELAK
jgi:tetratricopeptide (TPR) repeat protein/tRNA A-37 threonylcarbamoyl transferase component Bud32